LSHRVHASMLLSCDRAPPVFLTLSLHDALPICPHFRGQLALRESRSGAGRIMGRGRLARLAAAGRTTRRADAATPAPAPARTRADRKSTRLNSSHVTISYAVFCLKKKKPYSCTH